MKASHGGTAKNATIDSRKSAVLLRGGRLPQASGSPAARRATRALLRRRFQLSRQHAALLAHVQQTNRQSNPPEIGKTLADKANREGGADRFPEPAVQTSSEGDRTLIDASERLLRDVELTLVQTAQEPHAPALDRLPSVPGLGKILRLVLRDAIPDLHRLPRGQAFVSSGRLGTCAKAAAGNRSGTVGAKRGNTHLTRACSEAAGWFRRNTPAAQKYRARVAHHPGKGHA